MAATNGHGNARWSEDETILALDLYFSAGRKVPAKTDARVLDLSKYLRSLPIHEAGKQRESFRNPDGVAFKIQNLRAVETGKGLRNVSRTDVEIWSRLGADPALVKALALQIKKKFET